ncbi:MAG: NAD+ synthase [Candidatus Firestonebacteria bacterium]
MENNIRICCAQLNFTVGDLKNNTEKIIAGIEKAKKLGVDIISFPELAIAGYPPEDLLLKNSFIEENIDKLKYITKFVDDIVVVIGFVDKQEGNIYNSAAIIYKKKIRDVYHKMFLPNYGVFDENRYFKQGNETIVFKFGEAIFGVNICEDIWWKDGPVKKQALAGANLILNISASPYHAGKIQERELTICEQARDNSVAIVYTNLVGGQDELVFDGQSMVVDTKGKIKNRGLAFEEDYLVFDLPIKNLEVKKVSEKVVVIEKKFSFKSKDVLSKRDIKILEPAAEIYKALTLGLKDYVEKNNFKKVVVGLSGGIDSAFVGTIAADALGKENVTGVFMPTRYSSSESETDAKSLAHNLGIKFLHISIEQIYKIYLMVIEPYFLGLQKDIAEENLQARIRGNILLAFSNKFGWLVLTTGNKSEMSTGYATLYGDMAGGLAVIKDVPKTLVYKLAKYRNSLGLVIPERILTKEPTAELKFGQKDKDTLPAYEILDPILKSYVEEDKDVDEMNTDKTIVSKVIRMVDKSEHKRRQSPPGIKITPKAFGKDRRMPITNKYSIVN